MSPATTSEMVLYQTEDKWPRIAARLENETVWLTQAQMAELFQTSVPNVSMHIRNIFAESELSAAATLKEFLTVRQEGSRQVSRSVEHYNRNVIIAVGYRVKSHRGTQFRQWATQRLACDSVLGTILPNGQDHESNLRPAA